MIRSRRAERKREGDPPVMTLSNRELLLEAAIRESGFQVVKVAQGWAVRAPSGGLLEWEDGSPRVKATREGALDMAYGTLRYTRIAANTVGLMDD
jgi:hypothetical protein